MNARKLVSILLILVLGLGLIHSGIPASAKVLSSAQETFAEGLRLRAESQDLLIRTTHAGEPGVSAAPSKSDLNELETRFFDWKATVEERLLDSGESRTLTPVRLVNLYFDTLEILVQARAAMKIGSDSSRLPKEALQVPSEGTADLPGLGNETESRLGGKVFPLQIDRDAIPTASLAKISLSASYREGLELGILTEKTTDSNYFALIQFLATRQLLQNLADLRYLRSNHRAATPEIPEALFRKFQSLRFSDTIREERKRAEVEPGAREALARAFDSVKDQVPEFLDRETAETLSSIADFGGFPLKTVRIPKDTLSALIQPEIESLSVPISGLSGPELERTLKTLLADVTANSVLRAILGLISEGRVGLSPAGASQVIAILDSRKKTFLNAVPDSLTRKWAELAKIESEGGIYESRRSEFLQDLVSLAPFASLRIKQPEKTVSPSTLARALTSRFNSLDPGSRTKGWFFEIATEPDYPAAQRHFSDLMIQLTDRSVMNGNLVSAAKVKDHLSTHPLAPKSPFSSLIPQALQKKLLSRISNDRSREISDLLALGEWMGFTRVDPPAVPIVSEFFRDDGELYHEYLVASQDEILDRYPILSMPVIIHTALGTEETMRLCDALTDLDPDYSLSSRVQDSSRSLVDQALEEVEKRIQKNFKLISEATNLSEIEPVVKGAIVMESLARGFPEFQKMQNDWVAASPVPGLAHRILDRYSGFYLGAGFSTLLLLQVARAGVPGIGPWLDAVTIGLNPLIRGFMQSSVAILAADTANQAWELNRREKKNDETQDLFLSSAKGTGSGFYSFAEAQASEMSYQWNKWMLLGRIPMDTAFVYYPVLLRGWSEALRARISTRDFAGDVRAFRALGVAPGNWNEIEAGLARAQKHGTSRTAQAAYDRLTLRKKKNLKWSLEQSITSGGDNT